MTDERERLARAALTRLAEPGDPRLLELVTARGPVSVVDDLRRDRIGGEHAQAWRVRLGGCDPARDLAAVARVGGRLVCPGDAEWPAQLDDLAELEHDGRRTGPPVGLWVRGPHDLARLCTRAVSVVGSRNATPYGTTVAGDLAYGLAVEDVTVISGAAYGIDAAAHRGALAAGRPTVAVLACGVDVSYPNGHATLLERIAADGLVVSELPPRCAPTRVRFLTRNRLIAALSRATVVVEAALRSGALSTARWADSLSRQVMGVPGPVTSALSAGVHELFRNAAAEVVTEASEVLASVSPAGEHLAPVRSGEVRSRDGLDAQTQRVLEAVPARRAVGVARLAATAGLPIHVVTAALGQLYLLEMVERREQGWRLSESQRSSAGSPFQRRGSSSIDEP